MLTLTGNNLETILTWFWIISLLECQGKGEERKENEVEESIDRVWSSLVWSVYFCFDNVFDFEMIYWRLLPCLCRMMMLLLKKIPINSSAVRLEEGRGDRDSTTIFIPQQLCEMLCVWDAPFHFSGALSLSVSYLSRKKKSEWLIIKNIYIASLAINNNFVYK